MIMGIFRGGPRVPGPFSVQFCTEFSVNKIVSKQLVSLPTLSEFLGSSPNDAKLAPFQRIKYMKTKNVCIPEPLFNHGNQVSLYTDVLFFFSIIGEREHTRASTSSQFISCFFHFLSPVLEGVLRRKQMVFEQAITKSVCFSGKFSSPVTKIQKRGQRQHSLFVCSFVCLFACCS